MGDVYYAVENGFESIGLIDGYFEQRASVWHKELLWGLSKGVRILGSSSMGALRAAELEHFGMEGIGRVYEAYRSCTLIDDDEVAVRHAPPELGYMLLSDAMVDIRFTLEKALQSNIITKSEAELLTIAAKSLHFSDRNYKTVCEIGRSRGIGSSTLSRFSLWLETNRVEQKRLDAVELVQAISTPYIVGTKNLLFSFQYTSMWQNFQNRIAQDRINTAMFKTDTPVT